jgi:hypothetical protein
MHRVRLIVTDRRPWGAIEAARAACSSTGTGFYDVGPLADTVSERERSRPGARHIGKSANVRTMRTSATPAGSFEGA